jgi:antitoxin (DNA-binding transcriptional repressor) of toxin-antitoxin stability system
MRTMEVAEFHTRFSKILRCVEKNGESILITHNGISHSILRPTTKTEREMFEMLRRRGRKSRQHNARR